MQKRKKIVLLLVCFFVFTPQFSFAKIDSRCWTKTACIEKRTKDDSFLKTMSSVELAEGFIYSAETIKACGKTDATKKEPLGFCLPVGQTQSTISFGGKKKFLHIGEYIQTLYQYGIVAAGVLSVIMIIVAGFTWTTSGGNSERIGSAQKRIAGAITGLALAVLSYTLLNTLNPALVNIRLPQIWSINSQGLVPPICNELDTSTKVKELGPRNMDATAKQKEIASISAQTEYTEDPKKAKCGIDYFVHGAGELTCSGNLCNPKHICYTKPDAQVPTCNRATMAGTISNADLIKSFIASNAVLSVGSSIFGEGWEWPWANDPEIYVVCIDGTFTDIGKDNPTNNPNNHTNETKQTQQYWITVSDAQIDSAAEDCVFSHGGLQGFGLTLELNEEGDLTSDDTHLFSRNSLDLGDVDQNFPETYFGNSIIKDKLYTVEEMKKGVILDIDIGTACDIDSGDDVMKKACYGWLGYGSKPVPAASTPTTGGASEGGGASSGSDANDSGGLGGGFTLE